MQHMRLKIQHNGSGFKKLSAKSINLFDNHAILKYKSCVNVSYMSKLFYYSFAFWNKKFIRFW